MQQGKKIVESAYLKAGDKVAIVCGRGGYGTIHLVERIPTTTFIQHPKWITSIAPQWNKHITRQYLLFMSGTYTVDVRYMSGIKADMYRTSTEHIADNDRRCIGATRGLLYG